MKTTGLLLAATLLALNIGCSVERRSGYTSSNKPQFKQPDFSKIKPSGNLQFSGSLDPLASVAPTPEAPPAVQTEEVRQSNPDYKPANSYAEIAVGTVVDFRGLTLGASETMFPKQIDESNPVVIFVTRSEALTGKSLKLEDLTVTKKDGAKIKGREIKETELLLTSADDAIAVLCVYHGSRLNPQTLKTERQFLNRPCTAEEFKGIIESQGGAVQVNADY